MKILKFGGSSIGHQHGFEQILKIVAQESENCIIVVSACGKTTDNLLKTATLAEMQDTMYQTVLEDILTHHIDLIQTHLQPQNAAVSIGFVKEKLNEVELILESIYNLQEFSNRTYDKLLSYGEIISSTLLNTYLNENNASSKWIDSREIIKTNDEFGNAKIEFTITNQNIIETFKDSNHYVLGGFIASNKEGITTTLGRGGSDYTASIIAAALQVKELIIWTDVNGMMTADPRLVKNAISLPELSYNEALELCHFGAKVIYPPTIIPAMKREIPILVKSTFEPKKSGTLITKNIDNSRFISGLTSIADVCSITIEGSGMVGKPGFTKKFLGILSDRGINVIMVTQASSEHGMTMIISPKDLDIALQSLNKELRYDLLEKIIDPIKFETELSILAVVGQNMKNYHGIAGKTFHVLGKNAINIRAIAQGSSENNITMVISKSDLKKALNVLHEEFFEEDIKKVNLFIIGVGTVGNKLIEQIKQQHQYLIDHNQLKINIVAIANSKKMLCNEEGLNLESWQEDLKQGSPMVLKDFINTIIDLNLGNSIFVDNTANYEVAEFYETCLSNGIGIVTCNKIASSSSYERYKNLKKLSQKHKAPYFFETNVGAGLPIINTLNDLVKSGDKIRGIKAVLSGSLNFIMNNFKEGTRFVDIVKQAQQLGFTEPDPRIDLSGLDVKRKILILLRESGYQFELEDIKSNSFLGEEYFKTETVEAFLQMLEENGEEFDTLRKSTEAEGKKLKIVASFQDGEAVVGLEKATPDEPYYQLDGSDNIVLFYTDRYVNQPLIIRGAGAGADVTASGVFADIMRAVS